MKIFKSIFNSVNANKPAILLIGYFDSLHLGHINIIKDLINISRELNVKHYILTFRNLKTKTKILKNVLELNDKIELVKNLGVKNLILSDFESEIKDISPDDFLSIMKKNYNIKKMLVGHDFKFGRNREGDENNIINNGIELLRSPKIEKYGKKISTMDIKKYIDDGDIEKANSLLGRSFYIRGIVKKGKQLGRVIGFPTMNIRNENVLYPKEGTYVSKTAINNEDYYSMTYVSKNIIETNLIGYYDFHYNFKIKIDFFKKIRDNMPFKNIEDMKKQLKYDLNYIESYFEKK